MRRLAVFLVGWCLALSGCTVFGVTVFSGDVSETATTTSSGTDPVSGLRWITVGELPTDGRRVYHLIGTDGPFDYAKDGSTFRNLEGILPDRAAGYYREYTVPTPGSSDRGARRIVCGGKPRTSTADCYYTADHYDSFRRIKP